jgi:hypothetical protein
MEAERPCGTVVSYTSLHGITTQKTMTSSIPFVFPESKGSFCMEMKLGLSL